MSSLPLGFLDDRCHQTTAMHAWRLAALWPGLLLCLFLSTLRMAGAVPPDVSDHALRAMCERGMAESAVEYCRAQANLLIESPAARARWTMRQMEAQSQAALRSTAAQPNDQWQEVAKIESDYRGEFNDDPRLPWLAWQVARAELLRSQQALAKWLATPAANPQREQALQSVRKLNSMLDTLEQELKQLLPQAQNRTGKNQVPVRELHELQLDCALLRCESFLVRAKCYANESPDHLAALAEVDTTVNNVLRMAASDWPSRHELLVAQAIAGLEVGKRRQSVDLLIRTLLGQSGEADSEPTTTSVPISPPTELARLRAGCALVEALCIDGKPDQAADFIQELTKTFQGPEVDLAALRVAIAKMKQLPDSNRPQALSGIIADTKSLGERYGNYWRNRGEALLVAEASSTATETRTATGTNASPPSSSKPSQSPAVANNKGMSDLLTIEIRQLLAGGQNIAAIAKLRSAAASAASAQKADDALYLALEAARLMQKEKQWLEAADLLAPLALSHRDAKDAAAAHALAAWCVAQSLKNSAPQATEKRYEDLLREQLELWPDAAETVKGEEYLAAWLTSQKRFEDLSQMWLDRATRVMDQDRQRVALDQWLSNLLAKVAKPKVAAQMDKLAKAIAQAKLTQTERTAQITLMAAAMLTAPITRAEAETLTGCKLPGHELHQPAGDETLLSALLLLDAVYRNDAVAAGQATETIELAQLTSIANLAWCKAVALAADELPARQRNQWTSVFAAVKMPNPDSAPGTAALQMTKLRLEQLRAASTTDNNASLDEIKKLAESHASDPNLQLTYAAAVYQANDDTRSADERFAEAIRMVKRVALGTKKDSESHLRARWLEARWQQGQGDKASASQVAQLMLSSGHIQSAWWKARFESLSKE